MIVTLLLNGIVGIGAPAAAAAAAEVVVGLRPTLFSSARAAVLGGGAYFVGTELAQGNPRSKLFWGCMVVAFTVSEGITVWRAHRFRPSSVFALVLLANGFYLVFNVLLYFILALLYFSLALISGGGVVTTSMSYSPGTLHACRLTPN